MRSELHSTSESTSESSSQRNTSNVNRFHAESTTNLEVTPGECNSSAAISNCTNNISVTALTTTSASVSASSLELGNSSAADLAVAAAVYDFASFHHHHSHHNHPTGNHNCFDDNLANGISHWDNIAAHHSALSTSLSLSQHYHPHPQHPHPHQHSHQISSFGAFAISVPHHSTPSSTMTVQRVNQTSKTQQSSSTNGGSNHLSDYQNSSNSFNGMASSNYSINGNSSTTKVSKPRRRVATMAQRRAANIRERRRMFNLNSAFDKLRKKVPTFAYEKRLSRIETLRLAIMYIAFMTEVLKGSKDPCFEPRIPLHSSGSYHNHHLERDHVWNGNHYSFNSFTDVFQPCRY